jgi:hypothetical protein
MFRRRQDLLTFVPVFVGATRQLLDRWRRSPPGSAQRIEADMTQITFDIVCATLLSSSDAIVGKALEASADSLHRSAMWGSLRRHAHAELAAAAGRPQDQDAVRAMRASAATMLEERRRAAQQPDDLMHRLMAARDPETGASMNDEQLIDNLLTFYLAGHETTSKAHVVRHDRDHSHRDDHTAERPPRADRGAAALPRRPHKPARRRRHAAQGMRRLGPRTRPARLGADPSLISGAPRQRPTRRLPAPAKV